MQRCGSSGCCTPEDARDAGRTADLLGIPFYVWDLSERFQRDVIDDFLSGYAAGVTPNPCIRCNEHVKFSALLERALALGFDAVCTGHYARTATDPQTGLSTLHRAADQAKDQSYVLAVLDPERLSQVLFPLGDTTKSQVRREATERGLLVAEKPDSYDICFIEDGDTRAWLAARLGHRPGPVLDVHGEQIGQHDGAYAFTIGQRRGLRLGNPAADGSRRYVLAVDLPRNTVTVGPESHLDRRTLTGTAPSWCAPVPSPGARIGAQIRAHGSESPGTVEVSQGHVTVHLDRPVRGAAPGQTLVLYHGTQVLGASTLVLPGTDRG
ncbi:MAG: tRNA-uridine 2-sulfurtransferase [Actinomycetota bacterium]|nr:tRNA-uridine 2-sulfurtransferase [Actinomycetota bacterium]